MEYQNLDVVFNNKGEVIYLNTPSSINQYANNYKLRVGLTADLLDIRTITAVIKTVNILPTRLLMRSASENDFINANGVIIKNVYTYNFSQYDTKAFQEYMNITVNIQAKDDTIFNNTFSIPMTKGSYSTEMPKLLNDDGTLSNFIEGVYDNLNNTTNRLDVVEAILDPESTTKNPEVIERLETGISENKTDITSLKTRATQHETDITTANSMISNLDLNTMKISGLNDIDANIIGRNSIIQLHSEDIYNGGFVRCVAPNGQDFVILSSAGLSAGTRRNEGHTMTININDIYRISRHMTYSYSQSSNTGHQFYFWSLFLWSEKPHVSYLVSARQDNPEISAHCLYYLSLYRVGTEEEGYSYSGKISPIIESDKKDNAGLVPRAQLYFEDDKNEAWRNSLIIWFNNPNNDTDYSVSVTPLIY